MKKLFCILLVFTLLMTGVTFLTANSSVISNDYGLINALAELPFSFVNNERITKGEFLSVIADVFYPGITLSNQSIGEPFYDVTKDHPYYSKISVLKGLGIIKGDQFNNIYIDAPISYDMAVAFLLRAMDYEERAQAKGGYPHGYYTLANEIGLNKGVDLSNSDLDGQAALGLIYNGLFADSIEFYAIENGDVTTIVNQDKTILESRLGIEKYQGILLNDGFSVADNSVIQTGQVLIKETKTNQKMLFTLSNQNISQYFGGTIQLYAKENSETGEKEIVYVAPSKNQKQYKTSGDQILQAHYSFIEYELDQDSGKYKTLQFDQTNLVVTINGVKKIDYSPEDLKPENGFLTLLDYNNDQKIDFINVTRFDYNIFVDYVSKEGDMIFCKQNPIHNLDFSDDQEKEYRIIKGDELIVVSQIKEKDILSVAESERTTDGKKLYTIYVSRDTVRSVVSSYSEAEQKMLLSQGEYEVADSLMMVRSKLFYSLSLTDEILFRFDVTGKTAAMDESTSNVNYCYLINLVQNPGFQEELKLKIYSSEGVFLYPVISSKVLINGKAIDSKKELFPQVQQLLCQRADGVKLPSEEEANLFNQTYTNIIPRPATYQFNSKGEIIEINTDALDHSENSSALIAGTRIFRNMKYIKNISGFDSTFYLTEDTTIFKVPDIDRYGLSDISVINTNQYEQTLSDIENYGILRASELDATKGYDIQAYNVDPDTGIAEFALIRGAILPANNTNTTLSLAVFTKMTQYYDQKTGEHLNKIYYQIANEEHSAIVNQDRLHPFYQNLLFGGKHPSVISNAGTVNETAEYVSVEPLAKGDIISVLTTGENLTHIQRELNLSKINQKNVSTYRPTIASNPYSSSAYALNSVGVPFDEGIYSVLGYSGSYNMELMIPLKFTSDKLLVRLPYESNKKTRFGTWETYIKNNGEIATWDKFIQLKDTKITVVEEVSYDSNTGLSEIKVRKGDLSDLRLLNSYSKDGFYQASRIYSYSVKGNYKEMIIMNLTKIHNQQI